MLSGAISLLRMIMRSYIVHTIKDIIMKIDADITSIDSRHNFIQTIKCFDIIF